MVILPPVWSMAVSILANRDLAPEYRVLVLRQELESMKKEMDGNARLTKLSMMGKALFSCIKPKQANESLLFSTTLLLV